MVYSLGQERAECMKSIILGMIMIIFGVGIFITTQSKEQLSQSAPIVEQKNITALDNTIAMYQENDSGTYDEITTMPTEGYIINETESYCTIDGTNRDNNARVYTNEAGEHVIANLQKNEKCYLYFDKLEVSRILAGEDSGSVTDANRFGDGTHIGESSLNDAADRSEYVGLKYTLNEQHGNTISSNVMLILDEWYTDNLINFDVNIEKNSWFCNDRETVSGSWSVTGSNQYAAYGRLMQGKSPSIRCLNSDDMLSVENGLENPIGLITADEVAMAGGVYNVANQSYYLYTGLNYWTMSPYISNSGRVFSVYSNGELLDGGSLIRSRAIRPVINLKADTTVTGDGTASNPFEVQN